MKDCIIGFIGVVAFSAMVANLFNPNGPPAPTTTSASTPLDTNGFLELGPDAPVTQSDKNDCAKVALRYRDDTQIAYAACIVLIIDEHRKQGAK